MFKKKKKRQEQEQVHIENPQRSCNYTTKQQLNLIYIKAITHPKDSDFNRQNLTKPYLILTTNRDAISRRLEHRQRVLLANDTNVEVYKPRARDIDTDPFNRKPQEQILSRYSRQISYVSRAQRSRDIRVVAKLRLVLGVARLVQVNGEPSRLAVEGEFRHAFREYPRRESVVLEDLVDSLLLLFGGGDRDPGDEEETEDRDLEDTNHSVGPLVRFSDLFVR